MYIINEHINKSAPPHRALVLRPALYTMIFRGTPAVNMTMHCFSIAKKPEKIAMFIIFINLRRRPL